MRLRVRARSTGIGRLSVSGSLALPSFTKLGSKLSRPSWMTSLGVQMMFPRLFENSLYRGSLASLPSTRFSVLYSSDHASTTGYLGRVDFDNIEGTWTDAGQVHSGANQRETPHPVYDAVNNRVLCYVHDNVAAAGVTYSSQHTKVLTTTDLTTFTVASNTPMAYGHHTGYTQVIPPGVIDSNYHAYHILNANESILNARSVSSDGLTFSLTETWHPAMQQLTVDDRIFQAVPYVFKWGTQWYQLANISTLPRLTGYPANISALVAIPIVSPTDVRPTGGYYTLVTPSAVTTDPDYRITNYNAVYQVDGKLYILYSGLTSTGTSHLCLAVSDTGTPTQTSPRVNISSSTGAITDIPTLSNSIVWNAVNDALPSTLTVTTNSGTNNSSSVAGSYYELKTGSGSAQDLWIATTSTYDLSSLNALSLKFTGLTFAPINETQSDIQIGFVDNVATSTRGATIHWSESAGAIRTFGWLLGWNGVASPRVYDKMTYLLPYNDTSTQLGEWRRTSKLDLELILYKNGGNLWLAALVNDKVGYLTNVSNIATSNLRPYLRIFNRSTFPQHFARWEGLTVRTSP